MVPRKTRPPDAGPQAAAIDTADAVHMPSSCKVHCSTLGTAKKRLGMGTEDACGG